MSIRLSCTILFLFTVFATNGNLAAQPFPYATPAFTGVRFVDTVPKTIDLAEMAKLAVNGMSRTSNPNNDYILYFQTVWNKLRSDGIQGKPYPSVLRYEESSSGCQAKFMSPLIVDRIMTGDTTWFYNYEMFMKRYLKNLDNEIVGANGSSSRILEACFINYSRDGNPLWKNFILQAVKKWDENMRRIGDYGYWPVDGKDSTSNWAQDPWRDEICAMAYERFGSTVALDMLTRKQRFSRYYSGQFNEQGVFLPDDNQRHFHTRTHMLKAMLNWAILVGGTEGDNYKQFVKKSYLWAKSDSAKSCEKIGFFPEKIDNGWNTEGCCIADMIDLAIMLTKAGIGDYWDDADRWLRNQFFESQLTLDMGLKLDRWGLTGDPVYPNNADSVTNVAARSTGSFAGWGAVNEWTHSSEPGAIQHCCTGNGCRTLYYTWRDMLVYNGGIVTLNLLMNRASPQVNVKSNLPYDGTVSIVARQSVSGLKVRIPKWPNFDSTQIVCKKNGTVLTKSWSGRYLSFGSLATNDKIEINVPSSTESFSAYVGNSTFSFTAKWNTVTAVSPAGTYSPLYNRSQYNGSLQTTTVERFVSNERDPYSGPDSVKKLTISSLTASNQTTGHGADGLNDGDWDSYWESDVANSYAQMTLDNEYTVSYMAVGFVLGNTKQQKIKIKTSLDGSNWSDSIMGTSSGISRELETFDIKDVRARYVRLYGLESVDNQVHTCEIYGKTGQPVQYTFTASAGSNGSVSLNPQKTTYANERVTVTATPNPGYRFSSWSGDFISSNNPVTVTVNRNCSITANFISAPACNDSVRMELESFSSISGYSSFTTGIGNPPAASTYSNSTGKYSGGSGVRACYKLFTGSTCTYQVRFRCYDKSVSETTSYYNLVIKKGSTEKLNQRWNSNKTATGWYTQLFNNVAVDNGDSVIVYGSRSSSADPVIMDYVEFVSQSASPTTYTVTYNGNGSTGGTVPVDNNKYQSGALVTVAGNTGSLVKTGYTFSGWDTTASSGGSGLNAGQTFSITRNTILYAKWSASTTNYTLTTSVVGLGSLSPSSGTYASGTIISITATPDSSTTFTGWSGDLSGSSNPGLLTMNSNKSVTATFQAKTTSISIQAEDSVSCSWISGTTIDNNNAGYTGRGFVNTPNATNAWAQFKVTVASAGTYQIAVRYANSGSARTATLTVNGTNVTTGSFNSSGSWTTWINQTFSNVSLNAGTNTIRLTATTSGGLANIDRYDITK